MIRWDKKPKRIRRRSSIRQQTYRFAAAAGAAPAPLDSKHHLEIASLRIIAVHSGPGSFESTHSVQRPVCSDHRSVGH